MRFVTLLSLSMIAVLGVPASARTKADVSAEARLAKALDGRVAGKPVNCILLRNITSTEIIDHTAIVYRTGPGRLYVNTPRIGQTSLDRDDILITQTVGSQLCNLDTVRLFDRGAQFETGFVGLGEFVPYTKVAAD